MRIHWLIPGKYNSPKILQSSNLASIRLRSALSIRFALESNLTPSYGDDIALDADMVIIGKIGADCNNGRSSLWIKYLETIKSKNKKIILDYTDNHLDNANSPMADFYKSALPLIDFAVAPSYHMMDLLQKHWHGPVKVIYDPFEVRIVEPKTKFNSVKKLLWFGHGSNLPYLTDYLKNKTNSTDQYQLIILSNKAAIEAHFSRSFSIKNNIIMNFGEWSLENMISAAKVADGCIIPSNPSDPRKSGASSNRLITSFALGLPTAASMVPSYIPHAQYYFNLDDEDLNNFYSNLTSYSKKTSMAQKEILPDYSENSIGNEWISFFKSCI
jgi:hypothetical protein